MEERTSRCPGESEVTAFLPPGWLDVPADDCPARQVFDRVGDRWSMLVMAILTEGTHRFNQLRRRIPDLSQRVLTTTLRGLERDGLVIRTQYPTIPPQVDYRLTPLGRSLLGAVHHVVGWSVAHHDEIRSNRAAFETRKPRRRSPGRTLNVGWTGRDNPPS